MTLISRDLQEMTLRLPDNRMRNYTILHMFPFTSETKRMGIIVKVHFPVKFSHSNSSFIAGAVERSHSAVHERCRCGDALAGAV